MKINSAFINLKYLGGFLYFYLRSNIENKINVDGFYYKIVILKTLYDVFLL